MKVKCYLGVTSDNVLESIRNNLHEDPERLERQVFLFKEWLKCEPHLPKDVDDHLTLNFVRLCKCNLDKAKRKFEHYLAARIRWRDTYSKYTFDEKYFEARNIQREFVCHPKPDSEGYLILLYRLPTIDDFDFEQTMHFATAMIDAILFESTCSGIIVIYELGNFTPQHIARIEMKNILAWINMVYNISPLRVKNIHLLNLPKIAEALVKISLKMLKEKIFKRVVIHKDVSKLSEYLPVDILPDAFGGKGGNWYEYGDQMKEYLIHNNKDFVDKVATLQLVGPIPSNKANIYSFEDWGIEGSFRKLNID